MLVTAVEEAYADAASQGADGGAQCLLAEVEAGRGAGEPGFLGDGDEVLEFAQV